MKLKDTDYKNKKISKPGWITDKVTQYLQWRERPYDGISTLFVYKSYDNRLHEKGYAILDEELLESEGWIEL